MSQQQTKEQIYDSQINPLMGKIIDICYDHKIPILATFHLGDNQHCTTAILGNDFDPSPAQMQALRCIYPQPAKGPTFVNVRDGEGKLVSSTAFID